GSALVLGHGAGNGLLVCERAGGGDEADSHLQRDGAFGHDGGYRVVRSAYRVRKTRTPLRLRLKESSAAEALRRHHICDRHVATPPQSNLRAHTSGSLPRPFSARWSTSPLRR